MAAVTTAVVGTVGSAYEANRKASAQKKAGRANAAAANQALDRQNEIYDQAVQGAQPYVNAGTGALSQLQSLNSGDYSSFQQSPDYNFTMGQGLQAIDRSAAARGGLYSGGADADRMGYASGLASQNYNNYYNRIASLANMGQNQSQYLGNLGQGLASQQTSTLGQLGQANAMTNSATAGAQAGYANAIGQGIGAYMGATYGGTNRKSGYGG